MSSDLTVEQRFWVKVNKDGPNGCWGWTAATQRRGYGAFTIRHGKTVTASRIAWELENGPIPDGLCVLHRCDNPPCVNPAHLFHGNRADNARDKCAKGRHHAQIDPSYMRGERAPGAKLTQAQVDEIRARHRRGESQTKIAQEFPVGRAMVGNIVRGEAWAYS